MLKDRKAQAVIPIIVIIAVGLGGYGVWYGAWQNAPDTVPDPPLVEEVNDRIEGGETDTELTDAKLEDGTFARLDVEVSSTGSWSGLTVDILNHTVEKEEKTAPVSDLAEEYKGEIVVVTKKDCGVIDEWTYQFTLGEASEGLRKTTDWLKLGQMGSGYYTVLVKVYDDDGNIIDTDYITTSAVPV